MEHTFGHHATPVSTLDRPSPMSIDPNCSWCGGSGTWKDPKTGEKWPCIQCNR